MFNYSFTTFITAFLASNIIMILIALCFQRQKILLSVGYKVLVVFLFLTLVRFLFPVELPISRNIRLPVVISAVVMFLRHPFSTPLGIPISIWALFEVIWAIGFIRNLRLYIMECGQLQDLVTKDCSDVTYEEPYASLLSEICGHRRNNFRVLLSESVATPCLYGIIKPYILIPENMPLSREDLYYVLRHEVSHHFYHDILTKRIVRILTIIYWWNPACRTLRKQVDILLEMRIDDSLVKGDHDIAAEYLTTLAHVAEIAEENISLEHPGDNISLTNNKEVSVLSQRVDMMLRERKKLNTLLAFSLFTLIGSIYLGSYLFTFESEYFSPNVLKELVGNPKTTYAIQNADGTYDIYIDGYFLETVDSLEYFPDDIPVYK